jgi:hypothetical protein
LNVVRLNVVVPKREFVEFLSCYEIASTDMNQLLQHY